MNRCGSNGRALSHHVLLERTIARHLMSYAPVNSTLRVRHTRELPLISSTLAYSYQINARAACLTTLCLRESAIFVKILGVRLTTYD